jgi:hypothetical protein
MGCTLKAGGYRAGAKGMGKRICAPQPATYGLQLLFLLVVKWIILIRCSN